MKITFHFSKAAGALLCTLLFSAQLHAQAPKSPGGRILEPVTAKKDLYPAEADAKKEIEEALKDATATHKRVLLVFGGNWCYDCHVLDHALHQGEAAKLMKQSFVLVHVDIGEADKNLDLVKQYEIPLDRGVPAVAVLKADGKMIYSSGSGEFESARTMLRKDLLRFLRKWSGQRTARARVS